MSWRDVLKIHLACAAFPPISASESQAPGRDIRVNRSAAQTYYLIGHANLPVKKHGHRTSSASRKRLRQYAAGEFNIS